MKKWKVAIAGCGNWAEHTWLPGLATMENVELAGLFSRREAHVRRLAVKYSSAAYTSLQTLLQQCEFDVLLNLTAIPAHFEVSLAALQAGRHVYSEKPFAATVNEARQLIDAAEAAGVMLAAGPAHMVKPEMKAMKRLIDTGAIGKPALMRCDASHGGPEYFQFRDESPAWFYAEGAGALFDMGVHGLHKITGLLGPAQSVSCMAAISQPQRIAHSGAIDGELIKSDTMPDNYVLTLGFGGGTLAVLTCGYVVKASHMDGFEVYGDKGTLSTVGCAEWPHFCAYTDNAETGLRGWTAPMDSLARRHDFKEADCLAELIDALEQGRPTVLSPWQAMHVVEIMAAVPQALHTGRAVQLETRF